MKSKFNITKGDLLLFGLGVVISVFSFMLLFIAEYRDNEYLINSDLKYTSFFNSLFYCLFVAIVEEYLFRYLFLRKWIKDRDKSLNFRLLLLGFISSVVFGFLHLDLSLFPRLQLLISLAGISLFYAAYQFRSVYIAIGMHFSWNFIQGVIFPFEGSGSNIESVFVLGSTIEIMPEANLFVIFSILLEIILVTIFYHLSRKVNTNLFKQ
ncbi:CPBP family intramembrane glutamic endopeptidase [Flammeovirga sp. EKP202]|uniref:CPBP family intramembrane glutamic endopeptidase n=1 Tax=Flammeovirga sp. EKP202 TaxID=2770592 RepID=UPI00165FE681|nr:CPBP family intramembrane glutamic endopeptidase [Flammeovirga sp. EKP202]MBD0405449.1 CPBP family intramembrane metalloprotease [Flammeovirga sp. EKP202]